MKTDKEIDDEVATLRDIKPRVRRFTAFGDDNHAAIDAQIEVLQGRMDEDKVFETFDHSGIADSTMSSAREACDWMHGRLADDVESPAADWATLARPADAFDPYSGR